MATRRISPQQLLAVQYLLDGSNRSDALRMAGYTENTALKRQELIFGHPAVKTEIERRQARMRKKYELTEDWVVERLMLIGDSNNILAKFKKVDGKALSWDFTGATQEDLAAIGELVVTTHRERGGAEVTSFKAGALDPKGALDSLARKLGMFKDKVELSGELSLVERITRGRERVRKEEEDSDGGAG